MTEQPENEKPEEATEPQTIDFQARSLAQRYFRLAIIFFGASVLIHFLLFFITGFRDGHWRGERGFYFIFPSLIFFAVFPVAFILLWAYGLNVILLASQLIHVVIGRKTPADAWQEATCRALWPLPYASALGGLAYLIYIFFNLGGYPDDVIFGTIGNLLGAWCYLTIFWTWYNLGRANKSLHQTESPKPKRPWHQYSLRSLLIFMLVTGVFFGWLGKKIQEAERQRPVVDWIEGKGGFVHPRHYFFDVTMVRFDPGRVKDLTPLQGLTNLEYLYLENTPVSDLSPLAGLTNLKGLRLEGIKVSDLSPLEELANLKWLELTGTPVTKEEVQKLQKALPNCRIEWDGK